MVSLDRARECIGRQIRHVLATNVKGTVFRVDEHDVWVRMPSGETVNCMPEHLEWADPVFRPIIEALTNQEEYEGAQAFVRFDDEQNEYVFIGSPAVANDDDLPHMLYVGFPLMGRFHPVRPTADPWAAYRFEEVMGWQQP